MIVIFDLDDTLYNEIDFVKSGFNKVSIYLAQEYKLDKEKVYKKLCTVLNKFGRGKVFNLCLMEFNIYSKEIVRKCLSIYRTHKPYISLPAESIKVLTTLAKDNTLYVVTDGNKIVQQNKIAALKINNYVKKAMPTHNYGLKSSKPSIYCFELIRKIEKTKFNKLVYIGDNPIKDFVNIKKAHINTIRINQGMFKDLFLTKEYSADYKVEKLSDIIPIINKLKIEK